MSGKRAARQGKGEHNSEYVMTPQFEWLFARNTGIKFKAGTSRKIA